MCVVVTCNFTSMILLSNKHTHVCLFTINIKLSISPTVFATLLASSLFHLSTKQILSFSGLSQNPILHTLTLSSYILPITEDSWFYLLNVFWICLFLSTEKAMAPHSSAPAWKIPWKGEPGGLQSKGSLRVGHDPVTSYFHFSLSCIGKGNGNPLQCSCLENPRDRGACLAAVYGVSQSRTLLCLSIA